MKDRLRAWIGETHGTRFELLRHFLGRLFDSELVATPGEWAKVAAGAAAILASLWLILARVLLFKYGMLAGPAHRHRFAQEVLSDETMLLALAATSTMLLGALLWQSIFPGVRDYLALAAMPIRASEVFAAKLGALLTVFTVFVLLLTGPTAFVFGGLTRTSVLAKFTLLGGMCVAVFFSLVTLQGVLLNLLPARWFDRVSVWIQAALVSIGLGAVPLLAWKASVLVQYRPSNGKLLLVAAFSPAVALLAYVLSYRRYRRLLLEAPLTRGSERRDYLSWLLDLWIKDPREQAAFGFLCKTLARSRVHRLALLASAGLGLAWVMKNSIDLLTAQGGHGADINKFLLVSAPITLALFVMLGLRYLFSLPADLRANWMFQIVEREGRVAWLNAVERFVIWFGLAPVLLLGAAFVASSSGAWLAGAWLVLAFLLGAIVFERVFKDWRKLPFTCSYMPGKRPLIFTLTLYLVALPLALPVAALLFMSAGNPASFLIVGGIELAIWWRLRSARRAAWGVFPLRYEEREESDVDTYGLSGDGTTVAQEHFQREWSDYLRYGVHVPVVSPLDPGETWRERALEWLKALPGDVIYAIRVLRKSPGFALTAIVTLGLGLGLNAAFFTVFNAFVLRPLAVRDPASLVSPDFYLQSGRRIHLSHEDSVKIGKNVDAFSGTAVSVTYGIGLDGRAAKIGQVTNNYFSLLGVGAARGRPFQPGETDAVLVLSHQIWRSRFGGDENIVGRRLSVYGYPFEVIGVAAPEFAGHEWDGADFWVPVEAWDRLPVRPPDGAPPSMIARLSPGVSRERAQAQLTIYARQLTSSRPAYDQVFRADLQSKAIPIAWTAFRYFLPLLIAFGLTMAIPCANAVNIMLARAMARQREVGVRLSLGATRGRVVRQFLAEGFVIALAAGAVGIVLARIALDLCLRLVYATAPPTILFRFRMPELVLDLRVFLYMLGVAVLTTLMFALVPAAQATRAAISMALRGEFGDWRASRLRDGLVVGQVAVCLMLLIVAGVSLRGGRRMNAVDRGYDARGVIGVANNAPENAAAMRAILDPEPWVETLAVMARPLTEMNTLQVANAAAPDWQMAYFNRGSAGYFRLLRIPLVRGRTFTVDEAEASAAVVVVSEAAASRLWPGQDPIGKTLSIRLSASRTRWHPTFNRATVVGVCGDVVSRAADRLVRPSVHFPAALGSGMVLALRGKGTPEDTFRRVEAVLARTRGADEGGRVVTLQETIEWEMYPHHAATWLSSILGGVALLLTVSGIYGVMSYLVNQRTKEIGVRMALGATSSQVMAFILTYAARLSVIGLSLGAVLALGVAKYVTSTLEGVMDVFDLGAYALAIMVVVCSAIIAACGPARRAARVEPVSALRAD